MKNISVQFYILIALSCSIIGCVPPITRMIEGTLTITNDSSNQVKLKFYDTAGITPFDDQILNDGQSFETPEFEFGNLDFFENPNNSAIGILQSDSLEVIFNNERKIIMFLQEGSGTDRFSSPFDRNIYRVGNYVNVGGDDYLFTITEADYEAAIPCDGPCE